MTRIGFMFGIGFALGAALTRGVGRALDFWLFPPRLLP